MRKISYLILSLLLLPATAHAIQLEANPVPGQTNEPGGGGVPDPATDDVVDKELEEDDNDNNGEDDGENGTDPINIATGSFRFAARDHLSFGVGQGGLDLDITRYYASGAYWSGPLGNRWDSPLFERIAVREDNPTIAYYMNGQVRITGFALASCVGSTCYFETPRGYFYKMTYHSDALQFTLVDSAGVSKTFDYVKSKNGYVWFKIKEISDLAGNTIRFEYNQHDHLIRVYNSTGRRARLVYHTSGNLAGLVRFIIDPAGNRISYEYDDNRDLIDVTLPPSGDPDGDYTSHYSYDGSSRLETITDAGKSQPGLRNWYDGLGRAYQQQIGTPDQIVHIDYSDYPTVQVTDREGYVTDYSIDHGTKKILSSTVHDAAVSGQSYTTSHEYNADYLLIRTLMPDGGREEWTWDTDSPDPRNRANLLEHRRIASDLSTSLLTTWTYTGFVGVPFNKVSSHTSPKVNADPDLDQPEFRTRYEYDPATGHLLTMRFPRFLAEDGTPQDSNMSFEYDGHGRVTRRIDPTGYAVEYRYDDTEMIRPFPFLEIKDPGRDAISIHREFNLANDTTRIHGDCSCSGGSQELLFEYNSRGQITEERKKISEGDPEPTYQTTRFHLNPMGHLIRVEREDDAPSPVGDGWAVMDIERNLLHSTTRVTRDLSTSERARTDYFYDRNQRLTRIDYPEGISMGYRYNERDLPTQILHFGDPGPFDDVTYEYDYDENGRLTSVTDPLGNIKHFRWSPLGRLEVEEDTLQRKLVHQWDEDFHLKKLSYFDASDSLLAEMRLETNLLGGLTKKEVRARDHVGAPLGGGDGWLTEEYFYDLRGRPIKVRKENGAAVHFIYDHANRLSQVLDSQSPPNGFEMTYHTDGLLHEIWMLEENQDTGSTESDRRLVKRVEEYDPRGLPLRVSNALGNQVTYEWNLDGQLQATTNPRGYRSQLFFDEAGRRISSILQMSLAGGYSQNDIHTDFFYDRNSNLISTIARNGAFGPDQVTTYQHNKYGLPWKTTFADGSEKILEYDAKLRPWILTDPNQSTQTKTYDSEDRLTALDINPGPGIQGSTYVHLILDDLNRIEFAENDFFAISRSFNSLDGLEAENLVEKNGSYRSSISASYDSQGRIHRIFYPSHEPGTPDYKEYVFDEVNRISEIRKKEGASTRSLARYTYVGNRVLRETRADGILTHHRYDIAMRPISLTHSSAGLPVAEFHMERDQNNNVINVSRLYFDRLGNPLPPGPLDGGAHYDYDGADRLVASYSGLTLGDLLAERYDRAPYKKTYIYDKLGNRRFEMTNGSLAGLSTQNLLAQGIRYLTGMLNQYQQVGSNAIPSDSNGNPLATGTGLQFGYDYQNRPISFTKQGEVTQIQYGPFGRRIKTDNFARQESEYLAYWGGHSIEQKLESDTYSRMREFHFGPGADHILEIRDMDLGLTGQLMPDFHGNPVILSLGGTIAESYRYTDFGRRYGVQVNTGRIKQGNPSASGNPFGFQGRLILNSSESALDFRNRLYLPEWGRFAQKDPLGFTDSMNPYQYAFNNPINGKDPLGLSAQGEKGKPRGLTDHVSQAGLVAKHFDMGTMLSDYQAENYKNFIDGAHWPDDPASGLVADIGSPNNWTNHALGDDWLVWQEMMKRVGEAIDECDFFKLGIAFHFVGDYFFHRDLGGRRYGPKYGHMFANIKAYINGNTEAGSGYTTPLLDSAWGTLDSLNPFAEKDADDWFPDLNNPKHPLYQKVQIPRRDAAVRLGVEIMGYFWEWCGRIRYGQKPFPTTWGGRPKAPKTGGPSWSKSKPPKTITDRWGPKPKTGNTGKGAKTGVPTGPRTPSPSYPVVPSSTGGKKPPKGVGTRKSGGSTGDTGGGGGGSGPGDTAPPTPTPGPGAETPGTKEPEGGAGESE